MQTRFALASPGGPLPARIPISELLRGAECRPQLDSNTVDSVTVNIWKGLARPRLTAVRYFSSARFRGGDLRATRGWIRNDGTAGRSGLQNYLSLMM